MTTVFTLPAFSYLVDISSDKSLQIIPVRQDFDIYSFRRGFRSPTPWVLHPETRRGRHAQTHLQGTGLESVKTGEYFCLLILTTERMLAHELPSSYQNYPQFLIIFSLGWKMNASTG